MITGRLAVLALAVLLAFGGLGTAVVIGDDDTPDSVSAIDMRKDDAGDDVFVDEDDGDDDATRGDDGTGGGDNTGDGDKTRGNDHTAGGDNTGDGDATRGNDNTASGDSYGAPAPAPDGGGFSDASADGDD